MGISFALFVCGCSSFHSEAASTAELTADSGNTETEAPETAGKKILLVYFSRNGENWEVGNVEKGNTEIAAEYIAEKTGADVFRINPEEPYPVSYSEILDVAMEEKNTAARPAFIGNIDNWDSYTDIILGYPIWHGDMPMIVYTFLESSDFSDKTIYPFDTHGGSGLAGTVQSIRNTAPAADVKDGLALTGKTVQNDFESVRDDIDEWIGRNGLAAVPADTLKTGEFSLTEGTVLLNSGYKMPILGIGTYTLSDEQASDSVYWALKDGYRLIDTARIYGNENGVGEGIRRAVSEGICTREEIFVTTKMWTSDYDDPDAAINASLNRLGLEYIDLMILHHSQPSNDVQAYQAMEAAVKDGRLKSIGLSNYYTPEDFDRLVSETDILPAVLQNETHPYHQSRLMKEHISQYGTVLESWFPLGGRGNTQTLFNDETISGIASAHGKTSAQIILRWHLQAGNIAIPGSSDESHIQENCEIFDFELSDAEMKLMTALDKNQRFANY